MWIWIRFTCVSLFHYKISLLIFCFFSLIFASNFSLHFTWVIFASKRNKAKRNSSLFFPLFFAFFSHFFVFFAINCSLRFDLVIFASKRNKAKRNSSLFFCFFRFFHFFFGFFSIFFTFFSLNFRFALIFSLNFRLFYLRFCFRFLVFRIEVNHVKLGFFFASKRNEIFASISNFASKAKVRAHPSAHPTKRA
jgi:hypothetical protein